MRARYDTKLLPEGVRATGHGVDSALITVEAKLTGSNTVSRRFHAVAYRRTAS